MSTKRSEPNRDAWQLAEQFFGGMLPFGNMNKLSSLMNDPGWLDRLVEEVLQQAAPQDQQSRPPGGPDHAYVSTKDVIETHRSLIIQMKLPDAFDPRRLRLYVSPLAVRVEGLPDGSKRSIQLPREVQMIGIRSSYKDHMLEIRLPKRMVTEPERQINISIQ